MSSLSNVICGHGLTASGNRYLLNVPFCCKLTSETRYVIPPRLVFCGGINIYIYSNWLTTIAVHKYNNNRLFTIFTITTYTINVSNSINSCDKLPREKGVYHVQKFKNILLKYWMSFCPHIT